MEIIIIIIFFFSCDKISLHDLCSAQKEDA